MEQIKVFYALSDTRNDLDHRDTIFSIEETKPTNLQSVSWTRPIREICHTCDMRCVGGTPISSLGGRRRVSTILGKSGSASWRVGSELSWIYQPPTFGQIQTSHKPVCPTHPIQEYPAAPPALPFHPTADHRRPAQRDYHSPWTPTTQKADLTLQWEQGAPVWRTHSADE